MTIDSVLDLFAQAMMTTLYVVGPSLAVGMGVGLIIAVLQAATQIQENSLTFVPKLAAIGLTLLLTGRWSITQLLNFLRDVVQRFEGVSS